MFPEEDGLIKIHYFSILKIKIWQRFIGEVWGALIITLVMWVALVFYLIFYFILDYFVVKNVMLWTIIQCDVLLTTTTTTIIIIIIICLKVLGCIYYHYGNIWGILLFNLIVIIFAVRNVMLWNLIQCDVAYLIINNNNNNNNNNYYYAFGSVWM